MSQQVSPFIEAKYGWNYGENGWNSGADENWLKFSFLHDGNVDSVVASLPPATNGASHFLTTDNRFYFAVSTIWYSCPCPKWFIFKVKSTGMFWQFDGTSAYEINNPLQANAALESIQDVIDTLGTAAFVSVDSLATQSELDVVSAQANAYTDTLRNDLEDNVDLSKGAALVGRAIRTIPTMTDLRSAAGHFDGDAVWLVRHYAGGQEAGGGLFIWDADSAAADDNGVVISTGLPAGRWVRHVDAAAGVSPEWWGAAPGINSTAAIQAAIDYAAPLKHKISLPNYRLLFDTEMSYSGAGSLVIHGHGEGCSVLACTSLSANGITFETTDGGTVWFEGFSLLQWTDTPKTSGRGVHVTGALRPTFRNFVVGSLVGPTEWYDRGIVLLNCIESYFNAVRVFGQNHGTLAVGIEILASAQSTGHAFHKTDVLNCGTGLNLFANSFPGIEGVTCVDSSFVGVDIGVKAVSAAYQAPLISMTQTHINAREQCVWLDNFQQCKINACLFYIDRGATATTGSQGFVYIAGGGVTGLDITGGTAFQHVNTPSGATFGVIATVAIAVVTLEGLYMQAEAGSSLLYLSAAPAYVAVSNCKANVNTWSTAADVFIQGAAWPSALTFDGNFPVVQADLQVDSAISGTSVGLAGKRAAVVRVTGTTGASTITAITGGDPGRVVEIKSDVAGVTMVHGASLRLKNAANYVFGAGTTIALRCALDGTWDEMWRE